MLKPVPIPVPVPEVQEGSQTLLEALKDLFLASDPEVMKTNEGKAELYSARQQARLLLHRRHSF